MLKLKICRNYCHLNLVHSVKTVIRVIVMIEVSVILKIGVTEFFPILQGIN